MTAEKLELAVRNMGMEFYRPPILGAKVTVSSAGGSVTGTTDAFGNVVFPAIPEGPTVEIHIEHDEFVSITHRFDRGPTSEDRYLSLDLEPKRFDLDLGPLRAFLVNDDIGDHNHLTELAGAPPPDQLSKLRDPPMTSNNARRTALYMRTWLDITTADRRREQTVLAPPPTPNGDVHPLPASSGQWSRWSVLSNESPAPPLRRAGEPRAEPPAGGRPTPRATGAPAFSLHTAAVDAGPAFARVLFADDGSVLESSLDPLVPGFGGFVGSIQTFDRDGLPTAFFYDFGAKLFRELDPDGTQIGSPIAPGGDGGQVLGRLFGGLETLGSVRPDGGTVAFTSRSTTPAELFDPTCRSGMSSVYLTSYQPDGALLGQDQLGDPFPTQVGHGCFPPHTQDTTGLVYGDSFGVAYQAGDDLRLSTLAGDAAAEARTYSLGDQPGALGGVFFWRPAGFADAEGGGFLLDIPNGPTFEGAEDAETLGLAPWPLIHPTFDVPLLPSPSGQLIEHGLFADLSGNLWRVGTYDRHDLEGDGGGPPDPLVAEVEVPGCADTGRTFCAFHNRFAVTARYRTPDGAEGEAQARPLSRDSGTFWFFDFANRELIVKVLDACGVNGHFWVFAAGLTNVEVQLEVRDELTGTANLYLNPLNSVFETVTDTDAFACGANAAARAAERATAEERPPAQLIAGTTATPRSGGDGTGCGGEPEDLCLAGGRFRVEVDFQDFQGGTGSAFGGALTGDTGALFFFDPANVEILVKVLDACSLSGTYWVFAAGLTNVGVEMRVVDTETGQSAVYANPLGKTFETITDTATFGCS